MGDTSPKTDGLDLPLSANYKEVHVEHFILDLCCDISKCIFNGSITVFLNGNENGVHKKNEPDSIPHLSLDCLDLCVTRCLSYKLDESVFSELGLKNDFRISELQLNKYERIYQNLKSEEANDDLEFVSRRHFLDIRLPQLLRWDHTVITIYFSTHPDGPSLMWTKNQDGRSCVFTIGDAFNNRSLFPSQDMPHAMATWHCNISIPDGDKEDLQVLMTGETEPHILFNECGEKTFNYFSSYRMPSSTFALAVGPWSCHVMDPNILKIAEGFRQSKDTEEFWSLPKCRIHFPTSLHSEAIKLFSSYLPNCFASLASVLEPYPFQRLDVLIAPDCFDSLGLACPNLLILSQSILSCDLSMFYRVAHELCHNWFGILMGPRNWTEDWLTEGLCCYLEDVVHAKALQWSDHEILERNQLKSFLKYKVLTSELEYIPSSLQTLRPDGNLSADQMSEQSCVKNGIRSETAHVHYMKGFFLLKGLEDVAGQASFLAALKAFIKEYKGKLFSSQDILEYFFSHCPNLRSSELTVASLCQDWLDSPGLPLALKSFPYSLDNNSLYQQVMQEHAVIIRMSSKKNRKRKSSSNTPVGPSNQDGHLDSLQELLPDQVLLLLSLLLDQTDVRISQNVMSSIREKCSLHRANAEVQHAWCELIIQQQSKTWKVDVERFLLQHRAMGLYLYGELMISENAILQAIARRCYHHNRASMPRAVRKELSEILGIEDDAFGVFNSLTPDSDSGRTKMQVNDN